MFIASEMTGSELKQSREGLRLSVDEFAAVTGAEPDMVPLYENGIAPIPQPIAQLTDAFERGFRPSNWPG